MTEIRPFRGLRYDVAKVRGDDALAPPYDVVDAAEVAALHERSPYNASHLENPEGGDPERFEHAATLLHRWTREGVLFRDARAALYVYEQRTRIAGRERVRRSFFARTRLHRPEEGIIRPHEATLSGPREERLKLLRATHTNISPAFGIFVDPDHAARDLLEEIARGAPDFEARDAAGDHHRMWAVSERPAVETLTHVLSASHVTIADGHHRTHTALDYRDERAVAASRWTGNEPENFMLMGLLPQDDPGLVILPNHRLVRADPPPERFLERLAALYRVEALGADRSGAAVEEAWARVQANATGPTTFAVLGAAGPDSVHLATARSQQIIDSAMPQRLSTASKRLDAVVLTETVLAPIFGIDRAALAAGDRVEFTEDREQAREAVARGDFRVAFLLNPVRVEQVLQVADAREVMPQKTTYFYPKLATGVVFNPLDD